MNDTAAELQKEYDWAVYKYGVDSAEAKEAELEAQQFFKGKPAPVTLAFQTKVNHGIFS